MKKTLKNAGKIKTFENYLLMPPLPDVSSKIDFGMTFVEYVRTRRMGLAMKQIRSGEDELKMYFEGILIEFKTPLFFLGSPFQKRVWEELKKIPSGGTRSYSEIATAIGQPTAFRAVANANGANQFALVIPCHRVINTNGELGGYGGGLTRKNWLINHEKQGM